jgi:TonB family protein
MRNPAILLLCLSSLALSQGPAFFTLVKGHPLSAEGQVQMSTTLPNGSKSVSTPVSWKFYRDSEGRMRTERIMAPQSPYFGTAIVEIDDPVAKVKDILDPTKKIARTFAWTPFVLPSSQDNHRLIGPKIIEGFRCEGTRKSASLGSVGNMVSEIWKSEELQLILLMTDTSPIGDGNQRLFNIVPAEQSADLFTVPAGYLIQPGAPSDPSWRPIIAAAPILPPSNPSSDGAYRIGGDVSAPSLISKVEPKYSEQARDAKYSGSVILSIVVDSEGVPRDIKVVRPLGLGLDQAAIDAVSQWRFKPGMKGGKPVAVRAQVEVSFRLLDKMP